MNQLHSAFKNVPHDLWEEFKKYKTKNSIHKVYTKNREPVHQLMTESEIKNYNRSGSVSKRQSESVDVYVGGQEDRYCSGYTEGRRSLSHLQDSNRELVARNNVLWEKVQGFNKIISLIKEEIKNG